MREDFFRKLEKQKDLIIKKQDYYESRIKEKRTLIDRERDIALEQGILPRIIDRYYPKIDGMKVCLFTAIIRIVDRTAYYLDYNYIEDEDPRRAWMIVDMDRGKTFIRYSILMTDHYLERYGERNSGYKRLTGEVKEAAVLDILGVAAEYKTGFESTLYGQFLDPSIVYDYKPEDQKEWMEAIQELAKVSEAEFDKYFNLKDNISITKTADGYGIYRMEGERITMITWLSEGMLNERQKHLFETITQKLIFYWHEKTMLENSLEQKETRNLQIDSNNSLFQVPGWIHSEIFRNK